jgi:hypothetical protein
MGTSQGKDRFLLLVHLRLPAPGHPQKMTVAPSSLPGGAAYGLSVVMPYTRQVRCGSSSSV